MDNNTVQFNYKAYNQNIKCNAKQCKYNAKVKNYCTLNNICVYISNNLDNDIPKCYNFKKD